MSPERAFELLASARVARLATVTPDGAPHLVPVTFAVASGVVYHAVDHKPKSTRRLARLAHLEAEPRASLLADEYDDADWTRLWWVRVDGVARILDGGDEFEHALDLLVERYAQYVDRRPAGPVVALDIERVTGWSAA